MIHDVIQTIKVHSAKLTDVNLTVDLSTIIELLMLFKAEATEELFGTLNALF